ncbi:MAG TPA: xanthine dehydrogenase family protein subunit M [Candidatus Polarisedimenticolia bacterium]|nr:xanthine dehydrogenase family protein subunit M [Candidatus Polarisedimenticolia bacterium]
MRPFAYVDPASLAAASGILADRKARAMPIAGGVDLLGELKDHLVEPETLVNLKAIRELDYVRFDSDGTLRLGALATLTEVGENERVRREFPGVAQAALSVGSVEIRNVGTVGGNLCQRPRCWYYRSALHTCLKKGGDVCFTIQGDSRYHAILGGGPSFIVHPSDLAPALIACDARIIVVGVAGRTEVPLEKFYVLPSVRLDHETILAPGEIVTEVVVPPPLAAASGARGLFLKFREKESFDFALVSVAATLKMDGATCTAARIVLGGVAPVPWRSAEAEKAVTGKPIDLPTAAQAAEAALAGASPMPHNGYKVPLAKALVQRAILELSGRGREPGPA